jgi:NADPH:quinone reductase-like Zn-dependent oxidoreductase
MDGGGRSAGDMGIVIKTHIRRGRYPDFKGPLPFTPGYDLVGVVGKTGPGVTARAKASWSPISVSLAATHNMRSARRASLVPVPNEIDPAEAVCIPLAYLTAFQMLTRCRRLPAGATILVIDASGTVGTVLLDLARHLGLEAIGTCSAANAPAVERLGAVAIEARSHEGPAAQ